MNAERQLDKWIFHKKNRGFDIRTGVINGTISACLHNIAHGELILAPTTSSDTIPDGRGTFCIMMKPISRWVAMWGEFCADNSEPIYRKNFWGMRIFVGRQRLSVPLGGKIMKIDKVRFYCTHSITGIEVKTYILKKDKWIRE